MLDGSRLAPDSRPDSLLRHGEFCRAVRCPFKIDAGLSTGFAASGVRVLYNNLKCDKELVFRQGLDHAVYFGYDRNTTPRVVVKEAGK